jgi:hypothetical protein
LDKTTDHAAGPGGRQLKAGVRDILTSMEMDEALDTLYQMPLRRVINPLFSFLYAQDHLLRWRAVTALGRVTARLADDDREAARVVMRRFMWNLNDESGGIGWGSPEAMGEALASHEGLAEEFAAILLSYAREDGNYLEYEMLHPGLLWGIARLAGARPHLVQGAARHLMPYLESEDPAVRGLAAKIMGLLKTREARSTLELLTNDEAVFQIWETDGFVERRVGDIVRHALGSL